jgi:putative ABC transport system permease protein
MNPWATLRTALKALQRNALRSFLTALGIIIGVGAVIAMVAIGEGAKAQVEATFAAMGTNLLIVLPGSSNTGGSRGGFGTQPTLTWDDLRAIQNEIPSVRAAAAVLRQNGSLTSDEQNWTTSVSGTSPEYFDIRSWPIAKGAAMTQSDVESGAKVVFLGQTVADKLFGPNSDPLGQAVRIKAIPFVVAGVLATKGQSPTGQDYDDAAFVPVTTFRTRIQSNFGNYLSGTIYVSAHDGPMVEAAQREITSMLRDRHRLADGVDNDFSIRNLAETAAAQQQSADTLTALLVSIAFVSLLVGGIGIMNIMLVSVTERTREIGVRMAVGATPFNIMAQFLTEAMSLSVVGGMLGIASGIALGHQLAQKMGLPMLVRPEVALVAVGFSALVGVGFGLYPAMKASQLDPIDALRFE